MGSEFGQWREWSEERALDWELLGSEAHRNLFHWTSALMNLYRTSPCLYEGDGDPKGFRWLDCDDADHSLLVYLRETESTPESMLFVCNFTPVVRHTRLQLPWDGQWELVLNSDDVQYGGGGVQPCARRVQSEAVEYRGQTQSIQVTLPPLTTFVLKGSRPARKRKSMAPDQILI
jgi:1,4-alpha-glucan branching enzyme